MDEQELDAEQDSEATTSAAEPDVPVAGPPGNMMSPAEAIALLRRGELIEGVRIVGLKLKGAFAQPVRFRGATLIQPVFDTSSFAEDVVFDHCTLDRPKFARTSMFEKSLIFSASTLIRVELRRLTVRGTLRCDNIRSRGRFLVQGARFEGRTRFWEAQFLGWVEFKECEFVQEADFRSIHAEQGLILAGCRFHADALFRGATIHKKWQADGSRFEALLDFSKAKLHDYVYLEAIEQGDGQRFAVANALAERILVRPEQLNGRMASEQGGDFALAMQEYGLLKRNFESLHRYEHEDWAFYRFKVNQRKCKVRSWDQPWTMVAGCADWLLLDHGCGYGTNPTRAIRAALLIILGFALIYAWGINALFVESDHLPFAGDKTTIANRLMIGSLTSVSAFTSGFGDIRGAALGWMNLPLIAESLMGTLLWGLFIVAFSRKVI